MGSASGYRGDDIPAKWGPTGPGSTGGEAAFGMPAPRWRPSVRQLRDDAPLLVGAEARPLRDLLDGARTAEAVVGHGVERADADAGRDGCVLAHGFFGAGGTGALWAPAGGAGGGSSKSSILERMAVAL